MVPYPGLLCGAQQAVRLSSVHTYRALTGAVTGPLTACGRSASPLGYEVRLSIGGAT